jgi:homoserine O-succinyltransferase
MPVLLDTAQAISATEFRTANCVTVGLINNMPDAAVQATERQFVDLIRQAAPNTVVRLKLFSLADVPRAGAVREELRRRYHDIAELWDAPVDGLIVTGTEPRATNLKDEPYWPMLSRVVEWARDNTASTIWSCLAAHAAVLHADGIERQPFAAKLCGVFHCDAVGSHPMTRDAALGLRVPHSRHNSLPEQSLVAAGYRILTRSPVAGVDMFARQDKSFHLFLQGHPEYQATTLLREYRRDIARYLRGELDAYPAPPQGYFDNEAMAITNAFQRLARADRSEHLIATFPMGALEAGLQSPWRVCAIGIYEKWLEYLRGRKAERRTVVTPLRRAWRDWPGGAARRAAENPVQ